MSTSGSEKSKHPSLNNNSNRKRNNKHTHTHNLDNLVINEAPESSFHKSGTKETAGDALFDAE